MRKTKTKLSKVFALALVFVMVMSSVVSAAQGSVISNELEATFKVTEATSEVVDVKNLTEFTAALADNEVKIINITDNIKTNEKIVVSRPVAIKGSGHAIEFTGNVTGWQGNYVLHVYKTDGVTIDKIKLTGADAGLLVNGSAVTLTGEIDVAGNEFGGIESSMGDGVTTQPSLNVKGAILANTSEAYGLPTIWEDKVTNTVTANEDQFTKNTEIKADQVQYYLLADHSNDPSGHIANVDTLEELRTALGDTEKTTINIEEDIADIGERLVANRALTINGGGHTLSFTDALYKSAYGTRHGILVTANGVIINDIEVKMTDKADWLGLYGIQVYGSSDVVINDYTGSGADAALIVNGSKVELTGTTTVTGNEFGGIEVSKGEGLADPALTVTGDLVNGNEAIGLPTIWEDGVSGTVTVAIATTTALTQIGINGQQQYYLDLDEINSIPVKLSWDLDASINATVGQEKSTEVTANLATGVRSVENARLAIEVTCAGIAKEDFEFTSIVGGTEGGTSEENAAWLNDTVKSVDNSLTFFWGPEVGSTINESVVTNASFKFNKAGEYTFNIQLFR